MMYCSINRPDNNSNCCLFLSGILDFLFVDIGVSNAIFGFSAKVSLVFTNIKSVSVKHFMKFGIYAVWALIEGDCDVLIGERDDGIFGIFLGEFDKMDDGCNDCSVDVIPDECCIDCGCRLSANNASTSIEFIAGKTMYKV